MKNDLASLRIDRSKRESSGSPGWAKVWIVAGVLLLVLLGSAGYMYSKFDSAPEVSVLRVTAGNPAPEEGAVILNATGYIVAARKIQVASKVLGRVAWIGVDKGTRVQKGEIVARLEDDEFTAQLQQARGQQASLEARLMELESGSRPEEVALAKANVQEALAELENARINLERARLLVREKVAAQQQLDDAQARYERQQARVVSLERAYDLVEQGPRVEQILAARGQLMEAMGRVQFFETQLANTVIRAPVTGTILERVVEPGEFVTTSFVGERGAKGFVVTLADLNDLEVELDINQNDFARLRPGQRGIVTTDAYPDRMYEGYIGEISPEANRQKATVQVKVKIAAPDDFLRPEMNASVTFYESKPEPVETASGLPSHAITVPPSAVRNGAVFVVLGDAAIRRPVKTGVTTSGGVRVEEGLVGGEQLILNPPANLQDGARIKIRKS